MRAPIFLIFMLFPRPVSSITVIEQFERPRFIFMETFLQLDDFLLSQTKLKIY